jgi:predicted N-acetyltransferase YhbS
VLGLVYRSKRFEMGGSMASIQDAQRGAAVSVRDALTAEHDAIRKVLAAAYREYDTVLSARGFEVYLNDLLDLDSRAEIGSLVVAERAGRVVGTVTYFEDAAVEGFGWPSGWAGLRALGVDPAMRGLGIGRLLMQECFDRARAAGAPVLCLHTAAFMTAAVTMYEQMGFYRAPRYDFDPKDYYPISESVQVIAYQVDL